MFVRTLVTAAEPRALSSTDDRWNPKATSPRAYVIPAWTPVTLRVRAGSAGRPAKTASETKDETSRDIGIASLPLQACRPSGGFVLGTLSAPLAAVKRF